MGFDMKDLQGTLNAMNETMRQQFHQDQLARVIPVKNPMVEQLKSLVEEKGVKIEVRTSNEHGLPHGHVPWNGPNTTIGLDKRPMKNHPDLSKKQSKVIQKNWEVIKNGIIQYFPKK